MDTFRVIKHHLENDVLPAKTLTPDEVKTMLLVDQNQMLITLDKWSKIKEFEIAEGQSRGKLKEKIMTKV